MFSTKYILPATNITTEAKGLRGANTKYLGQTFEDCFWSQLPTTIFSSSWAKSPRHFCDIKI